ncbi:alpha/beta fold hydrolase [Yangia mangrovi]|uniref:Alpha/beta fold hydrolase n=1 Tax=Alloyangia mangrovi TaxID=1779329 RepID=A0A2A3JY17_9RHOB|nr:alpha/beta fold hydrolase [Alloyangia mangrovi]MCT4371603.1 alpha/beta fold hydrolase [Alloyangia mangrovi]
MPYLTVSPRKIFFRHWKASAPKAHALLLHGYGEHSGHYHRFANALVARGIEVLAPDAIGHGQSDGERGNPEALAHLVENAKLCLEELRDEAPNRPCFVIGHSMGAITALALTLDHAEQVTKLVLSGMPLDGISPAQQASLPEAIMSKDPFYLDELEHDPLGFDALAEFPHAMRVLDPSHGLSERLSELNVPVLLVAGDHDFLCPAEVISRCEARLPSATSKVFPDAYHDLLNDTSHVEVAAEIADWVLDD